MKNKVLPLEIADYFLAAAMYLNYNVVVAFKSYNGEWILVHDLFASFHQPRFRKLYSTCSLLVYTYIYLEMILTIFLFVTDIVFFSWDSRRIATKWYTGLCAVRMGTILSVALNNLSVIFLVLSSLKIISRHYTSENMTKCM